MEKHYFHFSEKNISMQEYSNIFVTNSLWFQTNKSSDEATFDLTIRNLPKNWGYYIFFGLDRFLNYVKNFKFDKKSLKILKKLSLIRKEEEAFYKNFKFSGDIYSIADGTVFFSNEPILRITGPIVEVNLMTALALNAFSYPIRLLTKYNRGMLAARKHIFNSGSVVRSPGFEQIMIVLTASYILDTPIIPPIFFLEHSKYLSPKGYSANINHATIKSFKNEREAYRTILNRLLKNAKLLYFMVDTYDFKKGLNILIDELKKVSAQYHDRILVTIDSGNIEKLSKYTRRELDKKNLKNIKIVAFSNLDEYKVNKLEKANSPINYYVGITEIVNITDAPALEAVFKISEIKNKDGHVAYKAKMTKGKESLPGKKQIFRIYDSRGIIKKDIIGLENEKLGKRLLKPFIKNGKQINKTGDLDEIKNTLHKEINSLPDALKKIYAKKQYPIYISAKIDKILNELKKEHIKN